jgi:hypothetical protein
MQMPDAFIQNIALDFEARFHTVAAKTLGSGEHLCDKTLNLQMIFRYWREFCELY